MQRKLAQPGGLVVARGPVTLTLHSTGAADLAIGDEVAELSAEHVEALLLALRAPGVAGLISRAALKRARSMYVQTYDADGA
jgi:hypothetical protein